MVKLSKTAFGHAEELVNEGKFVWDERDAWSETPAFHTTGE